MKQNTISIVLGRKGSGKSFLTQKLIALDPNVIHVDLISAYAPAMMSAEEFQACMPEFVRTSNVQKVARELYSESGLFDVRNIRRVVYPFKQDAEHVMLVLQRAIEKRYLKRRRPITVVVDEVDTLNRGVRTIQTVRDWVMQGRHFEINQIYATRRPFEMDRNISSQADHVYVFNTMEDRDLKYIGNLIPDSKVNVPKLKLLGVGDYLHYDIKANRVGWYRRPR